MHIVAHESDIYRALIKKFGTVNHGGCHGNGSSWYSAALVIVMVNYKILIYD